ncbi:MAG TPA: serine/threonine-protein kinase [Terriglobales bacterium]|nr:serine/threonine-protein kinase [Terriglobales bacterium]
MTTERWQRVKKLFAVALDTEPSQRSAFLDQACADDASLRSELEGLLAAEQEAGTGFLNRAAMAGELGNDSSADANTWIGRRIGAYQIVEEIGFGGMGEVYRAFRADDQYRKQVAIKLVRSGQDSRFVISRFKNERQLLANLDHPNIARLLEGGTTEEGLPYFVMELVEGQPINEYCDHHKLATTARLILFLQVCSAVQYAHQRLIIHRDLKPSNILVTAEETPKLLDFGIAKILDPAEVSDASEPTMSMFRLLTPAYASPEQVKGEEITTASDVYSLGVLLYELLTGHRPYRTVGRGPHEVTRAVCEYEPEKPSTVVRRAARETTGDVTEIAAASVSAVRDGSTEKLRRRLKGDLDNIVQMALRKDPRRRYTTVEQFATDIRRHLENLPVIASKDTVPYRMSKFIGRHKAGVAATAMVAITLLIGIVVTVHEARVARVERAKAERRFNDVRQLANKFIALDNEIRGLPGSTKVRMQMVSDSLQYLTLLSSDAPVDKDLALEIAYAYVRVAHAQGDPTSPNLGQFAEAEVSLEKAEKFVDSVLAVDPRNRRGLFIAATIAHDRMVLADEQNRRAEMLSWAAKADQLVERFMSLGNVDPKDVYSMGYFEQNIAYAYDDARHFAEALRASQRALDITEPVPSAQRVHGSILGALTIARWQTGDLEGALQNAQQAVTLQETQAASGHASLRINLANALYTEGMILGKQDAEPSLGRSRDALATFQRGMDIGEELTKIDPLDYLSRRTVAMLGLEIGNILRHNNPQKALAVYDHSLARVREAKTNVSTQLYAADLLAGSSYAARWVGRDKEARRRIEEAFHLLRDAHQYPTNTVEPMSRAYHVMRAEADDYAETGQTAQAIAAYQELLDKLMAWKPDLQNDLRDAICISRTWTALGNLQRRASHTEEAVRFEAQRADLWNHWNAKLPNAQFLLRQSVSQIAPSPSFYAVAKH